MVDSNRQIELKVKDIIEGEGAELIDFKLFTSGRRYTLRCLIDLLEGGITLGRCAAINKKVVAYLDQSESLGGDYLVEINSPGLDRKLSSFKDFFQLKGRRVSLWLREPVGGKEYLEGQILAVSGDKLSLSCSDKTFDIDFNKIKVGKQRIEVKGGLQ
ncbi:MAG: ribosome maturation factor [Candidatus Omnitrophota bacterium]